MKKPNSKTSVGWQTPDEPQVLEAIRRRAYELWAAAGCPNGNDKAHWLQAEREIRERLKEGGIT